MNHNDLCKLTAQWAMKKHNAQVGVFEYQNWAIGEFPDVLVFKNDVSYLYEIKVSRSDFLADSKKECRTKYKNRYRFFRKDEIAKFKTLAPELFYIEKPHLGLKRYYVCEKGVIQKEDVPEGWGLYWYTNSKFYLKKESCKFSRDLLSENALLIHAFRNYANGNADHILVQQFCD